MKTNWQTKKLSDVCFFQEGPGIRKYEYKKNGYPIINVRCVQDGFIDLSNSQAVDPKFIKEKWSHFQVEEGDILFTTSGTIGRTAMATKNDLPLLMNTSVVRFKSLNEKELDRYFLAWLLRSPKFIEKVKSYSSGTAQKNVGPTHLKLISISYPSLSEQKRIVKTLDGVFEKVEKAKENVEKNLQNSKALFESYLQNIFANPGKDWEEKTLGKVAELIDSMHQTPAYIEDGFPMVRATDIKTGFLNLSKTKKVDEKTFKEFSKKHIPKIGDIVFSRVGSYGVSSIVNSNEPFCLGQNTVFIIPKINSNYFYYFINSVSAKKQIDKLVAGTTQPTISLKSIKEIMIPFPVTDEQKVIVKKLDELSEQTKKLEGVYKKKLADLEELKKSVLNKAFKGSYNIKSA